MRTVGHAVRRNEMIARLPDLEAVKAWAKATFTKERIAEAGVVLATLIATGYLGAVLFKGIQSYSISVL